jgi:hypothetical protein
MEMRMIFGLGLSLCQNSNIHTAAAANKAGISNKPFFFIPLSCYGSSFPV